MFCSGTSKALNYQDALEPIKETLLSAGASFMKNKVSPASMTQRALSSSHATKQSTHRPQLDLIELALHGKEMGLAAWI